MALDPDHLEELRVLTETWDDAHRQALLTRYLRHRLRGLGHEPALILALAELLR
jgi:hypothetical protein